MAGPPWTCPEGLGVEPIDSVWLGDPSRVQVPAHLIYSASHWWKNRFEDTNEEIQA